MNDHESIFAAAVKIKQHDKRQAFLKNACGNNQQLHEEVQALLNAADAAGSFLQIPILTQDRDKTSGMRAGVNAAESTFDSNSKLPLIGNYQIARRLGEGGMGTVYLARHIKLHKEVALKVLRVRADADQDQAIARFEQERQAIGKLDHPNIVRALDAGELNGVVYLSMELIDGVDLHDVALSDTKLAVADACEVIRQAALGLQFAHRQGLIHRDIKPSNLMLTTNSQDQICIKILDLGLALMQGNQPNERLTDEGVTMGTFLFMAPEQAIDTKSVDHRADIYSLGATLYRLLAGQPPFSGDTYNTPAKILLGLANQSPPSLRNFNPQVPAEVVDLVDQMLARQPDARPQNLEAVERTLRPFCQPNQLPDLLAQTRQAKLQADATVQSDLGRELNALLDESNLTSVDVEMLENNEADILRQRVKKFWVDGVLTRTEEADDLLSLRREMCPTAVINPWEGVAEAPLNSSDAQRPIGELFEDAERSLLILGEPGAGKSITLLQLTRTLLKQSNLSNAFVPIVLHLSTWSKNLLPEWIEQEISAKYQIPRNIGRALLKDNRLSLMLDGLDEVRKEWQADCVEEINRFLENESPPGIVVSCRSEDYDAIGLRLKLHGAVLLKPLSLKQIEASLTRGRANSSTLMDSLQKHDSVMDLARSPLMLSVMKMSFSDPSKETMTRFETLERNPERMFQTFVDRMFRTKGKTEHGYAKSQTLGWLGWLAQRMDERSQSLFLIEHLQPGWFRSRGQKIGYALAVSVGVGLMTAIATMIAWHSGLKIMDFGASTSPLALLWLLIQIPTWIFMIAAIDFRLFMNTDPNPVERNASHLRIALIMAGYAALWMLWPITGWFTGAWSNGWIIANVLAGLMMVPLMAIQAREQRVIADIKMVEALGISAGGSFRGWMWGLLVGYGVYQAYLWLWALYLLDQPPEWFPYYWKSQEEIYVSISWPLIAGSCGLIVGGLKPKMLEGNTTPNQGMKMSLRNAIIASAFSFVTLFVTAFLALHFWLQLPENTNEFSISEQLVITGSSALWVAFLVAMIFGGLDFVKHWLTRRILVAAKLIPPDLVGFLDHAARMSFVKRAGGAYIFNHQLLLKYLANRSTED